LWFEEVLKKWMMVRLEEEEEDNSGVIPGLYIGRRVTRDGWAIEDGSQNWRRVEVSL
jgi:hypothetical protein